MLYFSGGQGKLLGPFSYLVYCLNIAAQALKQPSFNHFWLLLIICGCLAYLGNVFSTLSAQSSSTAATGHHASSAVEPVSDSVNVVADPLYWDRRKIYSRRRARRRVKPEVERARRERWNRTSREIDSIVAHYHALMPKDKATATGAVYLRYSTRFQDSVADQLRQILERAITLGVYVPRHLVFFDLAVRGFTNSRDGLNALREALQRKDAKTLLLFSTSRLFRKQYRTIGFVDQVHKGLGIRCIFVKSGVDTDDRQRWESILMVQSMVDQFVVTMNVANIQAAHQGLLEKRIVFGTLSFGFAGDPLPGQFTKRQKPRCRIILDPLTSEVVRRIFHWYVEDLVTIAEIIRRLNDDKSIPLPPRATTGQWTRLAVIRMLRNTRYRGLWRYGVTESTYVPDKDYTRQAFRAEPLKEIQIEDLRVVPDKIWFDAQVRLTKEGQSRGRKSKDGEQKSRPKLLNGLLVCPEHDQALYVGGPYGRMMVCPCCQRMTASKRPLFTQLNRKLAVALTCQTLAELVRADQALVDEINAACLLEVEAAQKPDPALLMRLKADDERLKRKIAFTRRTAGTTPEEEAEAEVEIKSLQNERRALTARIQQAEAALAGQPKLPTPNDVRNLLFNLHGILTEAALSDSTEKAALAREVIDQLTGGRIELFQAGERRAQRGWLQGRFKVRLLPVLVEKLTGVPATCCDDAVEVTIDYQHPVSFDEEAEQAWQMYKDDRLKAQIATKLNCSKSKVTKLIQYAANKHGEPLVDGRSRRSSLPVKHLTEQPYQKISDKVMQLVKEEKLYDEIAVELNVDRNTITAAVRWWHESRRLPVPDGRTRRKSLSRKSSKGKAKKGESAE